MRFKPGDKVVFLTEQGGGVVKEVLSATHVSLIDDMGFERPYPADALAPLRVTQIAVDERKLMEKKEPAKVKISQKQQKNQVYRIDLHIEELLPGHSLMTNYEMLQLQMEHFKRAFNHCKNKRIKRLQVIHGVGEGILRGEIHNFLRQFSGTEFHDMSYTRNGFGGTEVILCFKELD